MGAEIMTSISVLLGAPNSVLQEPQLDRSWELPTMIAGREVAS